MLRNILLGSTVAACVAGCAAPATGDPTPPDAAPAAGAAPERARVTDLAAFDAFIATKPTREAFVAQYPGVAIVMPGEMATKELRTDNSRFFAEVDATGRITGGRFQ